MMPQRHGRWRSNLERMDAHFTTKITQQSNSRTHKEEGVLGGESLPLGILGIGGRHGNVRERNAMSHRVEDSSSSSIIFFHFDDDA